MVNVKIGSKTRKVRWSMIGSTILTLAAGLNSAACAQDESQGTSARMQGAEISENQHHLGSRIEGSWIFNIDVPGQGITFHSLISFTGDGVVITSASLPGPVNASVPEVSSPFYGSWTQLASNRYRAVFYAFLSDATGTGIATRKVNLTVQLTSLNAVVGKAVASDCDLQGENCVPAVEFENTGKRIIPE
jgi:hypothetical protein